MYVMYVNAARSISAPIYQSIDNLAANFSRELADYIIYVIDVAGGDKVRACICAHRMSPSTHPPTNSTHSP